MFPSYTFDKGLIITIAKTSKQKNPPQTIKVGSRLNNSSKEDIKVANRCVEKKISSSEMQVKTTVRYSLFAVVLTVIQKTKDNTC